MISIAHCPLHTCPRRILHGQNWRSFHALSTGVSGFRNPSLSFKNVVLFKPSHGFLSTLWQSGLLLVRLLSIAALRHWQADRRGSEHPARLESKEGLYGFAKQGTSCLADVSHGAFNIHFSDAYSSTHPSKYGPNGQYWGGISWSETESWEVSSDSHREGKALLEKYRLHIR